MKKKYQPLEYLGYYQIIAGGYGIALLLTQIIDSSGLNLFSSLPFVFFCLLSILSGFLLLKKQYLFGLRCSLITQLLQVFSVTLFGYLYEFVIGLFLRLTLDLTNDNIVGLDLGLVQFTLSGTVNADRIELKINIIAILLVLFISKYFDRIKAKMKEELSN